MIESDVEGACVKLLDAHCPGSVIYKHADRWTAGIPDRGITWRGFDSWLEFKILDGNECIHSQLDPIQLVECRKLEAAAGRCWIISYRREWKGHRDGKPRPECLEIFRPSALWDNVHHEVVPGGKGEYSVIENVARDVRMYGVAKFKGYDHRAVVALIHLTHRREYEPR